MTQRTAIVADDSRVMRSLLCSWLGGLNYRVIEAADGAEALQQVRTRQPDIVLLDINMPVLSGLSVLDQIRLDPETKTVPVILITTLGHKEDIERGFQLGATDYLAKPLTLTRLLEVLRRHIYTPGFSIPDGAPIVD